MTAPQQVETEPAHAEKKPARRRRVVKLTAIIVGAPVLIGLVLALGLALWLNSSLSRVTPVEVTIPESVRPSEPVDNSVNVLLLGTDAGSERNRDGSSILDDAASATWPRGKHRSDATMILHIPDDRSGMYVISIPRDSFVPIFNNFGESTSKGKINSALSLYGPSGAVSTVENLTGVRMDHFAMIDWDGFRAITDALGSVPIAVDGQGTTTMGGEQALDYVRQRYNLPNGDLDRVKRQQHFLRSLASKVLSSGTLTNPVKLKNTLDATTENMAVDDTWTSGDMRSLAISMRNLRPGDMTFLTIPTSGLGSDPNAGSIVMLDYEACESLFEAIRGDTVGDWIDENPDWVTGSRVR